MKKMVVFDVDGTLFDTKRGIVACFNSVMEDNGYKRLTAQEENTIIGPPIRDSIRSYATEDKELVEELTAEFKKKYAEKYIKQSEIYPNSKKLLNALKDKEILLGIATLKTKSQAIRLLEFESIKELFVTIHGSEDNNKSKEAMLKEIKSEFGDLEYYYLGDTMTDYKSAKSASYKFIACDYGYGEIDEVEGYHVKDILDALECLSD